MVNVLLVFSHFPVIASEQGGVNLSCVQFPKGFIFVFGILSFSVAVNLPLIDKLLCDATFSELGLVP